MRLFMAAARWLLLILIPVTVSALGLGDINVKSSLNQPFVAEIPLNSLENTKPSELNVVLASPETFRRYGLDRPAYLSDLRFTVEENAGSPVIRVTSQQPVAEPFVTLLIDVSWSSGRLLREYTALLDPPLFDDVAAPAQVMPAQSAPAEQPSATAGAVIRPLEPPAEPVPAQADVVESTGLFQESAVPEPAAPIATIPEPAAPVAEIPQPAPVENEAVAPASASSAQLPSAETGGSYTSRKGDSLWGIAQRVRGGTGLDINQMMLTLYRTNPEAFMGNINALKAGVILRIPPVDSASVPSIGEAGAEVSKQNTAWQVKREGSTSASSATAADAQAQLKLVPPSDGSANGTSDQGAGASGTAAAGESDAAATSGLRSQISVLEKQLEESKRLLSVRDSELQNLQNRIAELEKAAAADTTYAGPSEGPPAVEQPDVTALPEEPPVDAIETPAIAGEQPVTETPGPAATPSSPAPDDAAQEPAVVAPKAEEPAAPQIAETDVSESAEVDSASASVFGNLWLLVGAGGLIAFALTFFFVRRRQAAAADGSTEDWVANRNKIDHADTRQDFSVAPEPIETPRAESVFAAPGDADESDVDLFGDASRRSQPVSGSELSTDRFTVDDFAPSDLGMQEAAGQDEVETPLEKTISTGAPLNLDQADPIAEAEFHMAYGLYDQAADLLSRALKDDPDNRAYRLKLIEVFFVWENKEGFIEQARALQSVGVGPGDPDWNKVLILGKQLCPADTLFSGAASSPVAGSMDLELSDAGETAIDFPVAHGEGSALDVDFDASLTGDGLDFDLNSGFGGDQAGDQQRGGSAHADTIALDSKSLDFDLGGADDAKTMESPTLDVLGAGSPTVAVDFSLDGGETMESPTIQSPANEPTVESPGLDSLRARSVSNSLFENDPPTDPTGLDIDLSGLADLPLDSDDFGSLGKDSFADAGPVFGNDTKRLSPETENIYIGNDEATLFAGLEQLGKVAGDTHEMDHNAKVSDTVEQPQFNDGVSDTAEQPGLDDSAEFNGDFDDLILSDDPKFPDDATMTEVGTKLDLARAYIDMGDPEGARSILEEVLDEGGETQQQQARQLLSELND